ncbi:RCC1 domain-containing protein [Sorangium cellulosum]|uniref:RCC1 domain-containing protein n=1 Tax=Sorangium cellulosum TaxID=56 RepID=UPI0013313863|nr:RCC1 domain-containing protein [Sorangium cellulosum]
MTALGALAGAAGCGKLLGLDGFTDQPAQQGAGGGGDAECAAPADCPGGEHGAATCAQGACGFQCEDGFDDCDDEVGCETATSADKQNCGGCGVTCSAYCEQGSCNDPVDVAVGRVHACAILKDGSVWCWGQEVDDDETSSDYWTTRLEPARVPLPGPAVGIAAGDFSDEAREWHTCALLADGTVHCWGMNMSGQLGLGSGNMMRKTPNKVGIENIDRIGAGGATTCAIDKSDRLFCWGRGFEGQLAVEGMPKSSVPVEISIRDEPVAHVAVGLRHVCAVTTDGSLYCWGDNRSAQLGDTVSGFEHFPNWVHGVHNVKMVSCGRAHTCALTTLGTYCWGANGSGQLGVNSTQLVDAPVALELKNVGSVYTGYWHSGALVDGSVFMWGDNAAGQYGNGLPISESVPTDTGMSGMRKLALGEEFSCGLTETGVLQCWGYGGTGELGNGTTDSSSVPVPVRWPERAQAP